MQCKHAPLAVSVAFDVQDRVSAAGLALDA
jgi:hypothetical protein